MLKSFKIIEELSEEFSNLLDRKDIIDYRIVLTLNHELNIYIVLSDSSKGQEINSIINNKVEYYSPCIQLELLTAEMHKDEEYAHVFQSDERINYGVRRSLNNLLTPVTATSLQRKTPVITFYSYKGGVGRTTSLAIFSGYYANLGKKVFIIDCDFEAPGLLNFFNVSQFDNPKNGVIEYINDKKFSKKTILNDDYVYEIASTFSGEGKIHMMPAGNIFEAEKLQYLEGLARIDIQGEDVLLKEFQGLIQDIESRYTPDLILFDSRTGFNNVFGSLAQLSDSVVAISGDDCQNEPGIEFLLENFSCKKYRSSLCFVLSIISTSMPKRFDKFKNKINELSDAENGIPVFCFPRESMLELIGTDIEDIDDIKHFMSKENTTSYTPFFHYLNSEIARIKDQCEGGTISTTSPSLGIGSVSHIEETQILPTENEGSQITAIPAPPTEQENIPDKILTKLKSNFPEQYAENIEFEDSFFEKNFYIRQCMQDLFLPEYKILLGGKGTGKTAFYKALQDNKFFDVLISRAQKSKLGFKIINVISEPTARENMRFIDLSAHSSDEFKNENFVRRFWNIYIWIAITNHKDISTELNDLMFEVKNDFTTFLNFKRIIENDEAYASIETDLSRIDKDLRRFDQRLLVTFDQLDFVVKPIEWDVGVAPLVRLCHSNTWDRIQPKLFLRRDLFDKLGNITNKNALTKQIINLEWSQEEIFAFLFKVIFTYAKEEFLYSLRQSLSESFVKNEIEKRLSRQNQYNQLPPETFLLRPLAQVFFGPTGTRDKLFDAYDGLYNILKNADKTISLRPFLDLIQLAIAEQEKESAADRGNAILGVEYCYRKNVRSQAVDRHFKDLANEAGNILIKYFVEDIKNGIVPDHLKYSSLLQREFDELVSIVQENHEELKNIPITLFEDMLKLNGIIFITHISGGRKKYSFAFLYQYYMGLKSPKTRL